MATTSGSLLVASFVLWSPVAVLPARVWTAPLRERLALVAARRRAWQLVHLSIAGATVMLVLGLALLSDLLEQAGAGALASLSVAALLLGAPLWLAALAFRTTPMTSAAEEGPTAGLALASAWAGGLFLAWTVLANAAAVGFGAAIVSSGYPAAWSGWAAIALGALMLAQLLATGDALPALYHVGPALVGVALLLD